MTIKPVIKKKKINPMAILKEKKSLVDKIESELSDKGVDFFKPSESGGILHIDNDYLTLPKDITELPSQELGRYLNSFTQHRMYMRTLIGWQILYLEEAKRKYYETSTPIYNELDRKQFPSEVGRERYLNNHPEVIDVFMDFKDEKRKMDLFNLNLLSIDDAIFLVSREISRRSGDFERETRNQNVQKS